MNFFFIFLFPFFKVPPLNPNPRRGGGKGGVFKLYTIKLYDIGIERSCIRARFNEGGSVSTIQRPYLASSVYRAVFLVVCIEQGSNVFMTMNEAIDKSQPFHSLKAELYSVYAIILSMFFPKLQIKVLRLISNVPSPKQLRTHLARSVRQSPQPFLAERASPPSS